MFVKEEVVDPVGIIYNIVQVPVSLRNGRKLRGNTEDSCRPTKTSGLNIPAKSTASMLRNAIISSLKEVTQNESVIGCDISGGIDSTSLYYLLQRLDYNQEIVGIHVLNSFDEGGDDFAYASKAAMEEHIELELIRSSNSSFDPSPDALNRLTGNYLPMWYGQEARIEATYRTLQHKGASIYITGIGGDELFDNRFTEPAQYLKNRRYLMALNEYWKQRQKYKFKTKMRSFVAGAYGSPTLEISRVVKELRATGYYAPTLEDPYRWYPTLKLPNVFDESLVMNIADDFEQVAQKETVQNLPMYAFQIEEFCNMQQQFIDEINDDFSDFGVTMTAPYLKSAVIETAIALDYIEADLSAYPKPGLRLALKELVPNWVLNRRNKEDFTDAAFTEYYKNEVQIRRTIKNGILSDLGIFDHKKLDRFMGIPVHSLNQIELYERIYGMEKWCEVNLA